MPNSIACPTVPPNPPTSKKRKRARSVDDDGIATPPSSSESPPYFSAQYLKSGNSPLLPSPPSSIQVSPEPSPLGSSKTLFNFIQDLKNGRPLSQSETSFAITAEEFQCFEEAVRRDKPLSRYCRKKLSYEWDSASCVFAILRADKETEKICSGVSRCLEEQLRQLAEPRHTLEGLDSWESSRAKELVDLIRPWPLRRLQIGNSRMSPDLGFTFGTTESLLGAAQRHQDPLVVFEVRCVGAMIGREDMEQRAVRYFEAVGEKCPFRHSVKTVVLVHYLRDEVRAQIMIRRLRQDGGKSIVTAKVLEPSCRQQSVHVDLTLTDFLPQDAIELGFTQDESGKRACDDIGVDVDVCELVRQATGPRTV